MDTWWVSDALERSLQNFDPRIECDGDTIYLYIYGVSGLSRRQYNNLWLEIDAICEANGLEYELEKGDEWCWTITEA